MRVIEVTNGASKGAEVSVDGVAFRGNFIRYTVPGSPVTVIATVEPRPSTCGEG